MVGGIGAASLEHTVTDVCDGRIVDANLADYLVPVNADVPSLRAIYLRGEDLHVDPLGVKPRPWVGSVRCDRERPCRCDESVL
jgi:xanthine dehydrogenase YagR molybdenum-binding subunit